MVASAVTALIAAVMLGLVLTTLGNWSRSQDSLVGGSQARQVLDQMAQDLEGAWYRDDGNTWLAATVQPGYGTSGAWVDGAKPPGASFDPTAPSLADARFGVAGVWLRFFTTRQGGDPRTNDPAAPVAVAYQIIRRAATPGNTACHYLLYRSEASPSATLNAGYDLTSGNYTNASDITGSAGNIVSPDRRQAIADNVIDLGVRFYGYGAAAGSGDRPLIQLFPLDGSALEYRTRTPATTGGPAGRMPAVVDVMLRILTYEGARQLEALEAGRIAGDWWEIAQAHSQVFTRRVVIQCGPF
jgi:hypothetical protein